MTIDIQNALEDISCPLCGTQESRFLFSGRDKLHNLPGIFNVVSCVNCELMRTNPRPTPMGMGKYYPDNYGPYLGTQVISTEASSTFPLANFFRPLYRKIVRFNTLNFPQIVPGRLLEFGCASGSFLEWMAKCGWEVEGIEFSDTAAQAARKLGHSVHTGPLETAPNYEKPFDLIVGWMVLEHLHEPIESLKKLRQCAHKDSWLVLSVPNAGSLEFKFFNENWYALQLPTHLFHFTPQSIEIVLKAGGWKLEKIYHQRVLGNLIASIGYSLEARGLISLGGRLVSFTNNIGKWDKVLYPIAWLLSCFGQTGRMTIWAKAN